MPPTWWPFKKRAPLFHRVLGKDENLVEDDQAYQNLIDDLATKRRVRKKDSFGRNALHIACMNCPDIMLLRKLVDLHPSSLEEPDKVGRLPLHTACSNGADLEAIVFLVDQHPNSIYETTDRGSTALFCAIENGADIDVVSFLVDLDPESMQMPHYKLGKTPIHAAASHGASLEVVEYLLRHRPEAKWEEDAWGKTPLACACTHASASNPNASALLHRLIDSTRIIKTDRAGMLPLHIAVSNSATLENVVMLIDAYPQAIRKPDNNGRLVLHAACTNPRVELDLLRMLIIADPNGLKTFDKYGSLPLHLAIQRKLPTNILLFLMDQQAGSVRTREASTMMYPLHLACRSGCDKAVLDKMVNIYPKAIEAVDKKGNTFFHVACMYRQLTVEYCESLLDYVTFDTIRQTNDDLSLPLHLAVQHKAPMRVLQLLIDYYPDALMHKDKRGNLPMHKAFQNNTNIHTLVRLAQRNHLALNRRNKRHELPEDCAGPLLQKRFRRARRWYNLRMAFCPRCIRTPYGPE